MSQLSTYVGVFLDGNSKGLLQKLQTFVPKDWIWYGDHMTIKYIGKMYPEDFPEPYNELALSHKPVKLIVTHIGISDEAIAVKVEGYPMEDQLPHITLATPMGGSPKASKNITNWKKIKPFTLHGTIAANGDMGDVITEEDVVSDTLVPFTGRREDSLDGTDPNEQAWAAPEMHVKYGGTMTESVVKKLVLEALGTNPPLTVRHRGWFSPDGEYIPTAAHIDYLQSLYPEVTPIAGKGADPEYREDFDDAYVTQLYTKAFNDGFVRVDYQILGKDPVVSLEGYNKQKVIDILLDKYYPYMSKMPKAMIYMDIKYNHYKFQLPYAKEELSKFLFGDLSESIIKNLIIENLQKSIQQTITIDGIKLPIVVIPRNLWAQGKDDPTEYSPKNKFVRIRSDYDYNNDPMGYMRHELQHYLQDTQGVVNDNKPYPENNIEQQAYLYQFNYLKQRGYKNLDDVLRLIGKEHHKNTLSKYWNGSVLNEITTTFPYNVGDVQNTYDSWTDSDGDRNKEQWDTSRVELREIEYTDITKLPFLSAIEKAGGKVYQVGGAVRDSFMGKTSKDLDIMVSGVAPETLMQALKPFGVANLVGQSFGVIKFKPFGAKEDIDIALARSDKKVGVGHKGIQVSTDPSITVEQDLVRRDFTINAIAKDIHGNIIDPFHGIEDLKNRVIRMVSPAAFAEDPLRMLRAVQFAARFGFTIEPNTMQEIQQHANDIKSISAERILEEFNKMIQKGHPEVAAKMLVESGLYKGIFGTDFKGSYEDFPKVKRMSEFIYLLAKDSQPSPAAFFKNKLKGDIDTFKELKVFEIALPEDEADERWLLSKAYNIAPEAVKSFITQDKLRSGQEHPEEKYPRVASKLAISGDEINALGIKGQFHGMLNRDLMDLIYKDQLENTREAILDYINKNIEKYKSNTPEKIREITESVLNSIANRDLTQEVSNANVNTYYRAEDQNIGKTVTLQPSGYYEAVDKDDNPVMNYGEFWESDTPEISASKKISGAILGAFSMRHKAGTYYIYTINDKPDVDISHWTYGDFGYMEEVRFRKPVNATLIGTVILNDKQAELLNQYYEVLNAGINQDYEVLEKVNFNQKAFEKLLSSFNLANVVKEDTPSIVRKIATKLVTETIVKDINATDIPMNELLPELTIGILSPEGRFIKANDYNSHLAAFTYAARQMPGFAYLPQYQSSPDDYLLRQGWIKITSHIPMPNRIIDPTWFMWWNHELTPIQKKIFDAFAQKYEAPHIRRKGNPDIDQQYDNPNKRNLYEEKELITEMPKPEEEYFHLLGMDFNVGKAYDLIQKGKIEYKIIETTPFDPGAHLIRIYPDVMEKHKDDVIDYSKPIGLWISFLMGGEKQTFPIDGNHRMYRAFKDKVPSVKVYFIWGADTVAKISEVGKKLQKKGQITENVIRKITAQLLKESTVRVGQRQIDALEKKIHKYYQEAYDVGGAAYIAPSGYMTSLIPRDGGSRDDHRAVGSIIDDLRIDIGRYAEKEWEHTESRWLLAIMEMGFIRVIPESGAIEIHTPPTGEQYEEIRNLVERENGSIILDLVDDERRNSIEFHPETSADWIEEEIRRFFYYGEAPRQWDELEDEEDEDLMEGKTAAQPILILPIGISGSGKSRWISTLPKDEYVIISPDDIRRELTGNVTDNTKDAEVFQLADARVEAALKANKTVIVDATNVDTEFRRPFIEKIKAAVPNVKIYYKLFDANPDVSKERIKKDIESGKDRSNVPDEVVDTQFAKYQQTLQDIGSEDMQPLEEEKSKSPVSRYWADEKDLPPDLKDRLNVGKKPTPEQETEISQTKKLLGYDPHGIPVYTVNGELIRQYLYPDFALGGNDQAYPNFVPKNEIWVDQDLRDGNRETTISHESVERHNMYSKHEYYDVGSGSKEHGAHIDALGREHDIRAGKKPPIRLTKRQLQEAVKNRGKVWRLVIFDMDDTLIASPDPLFGKAEWQKKTGEQYPHKGWWSKPESLNTDIFDIKAIPPVFNQMRDEQRRSDTMVVIMTNRLDTLEREVKNVLKKNQINPDMLSMAEFSQQNKGDRVLDIIRKNPDIKYVAFYDDQETNIENVRQALKGKGITYDLYNCQDGKIRRT